MKRLIFALSILALFGANPAAQAKTLTFNFDVLSSGPAIYACNAGIMHKPAPQVCYKPNTHDVCTPDYFNPNNKQDCVCSGGFFGNEGGDHLKDFARANAYWWDNPVTPFVEQTQAGDSTYNKIFDDNFAWSARINQLEFDLGSELYGAQYYVDICYRGSQIEYFQKGMPLFVELSAGFVLTDEGLVNGTGYANLSDLKVHAEYSCDLQGQGVYEYASYNGTPSGYDQPLPNEVWLGNAAGDAAGDKHNASYTVDETGTAPQGSYGWYLFNHEPITPNNTHAPRFCKVRYYFDETAIENLRTWQLHGAHVKTITDIQTTF